MTEKAIIDMWRKGVTKITIAKEYRRLHNKNIKKDGKKITEREALAYVEPSFHNAFEMRKEKEEWFEVNIPGIFEIDNKTAWSTMPKEMKKYIQSLEEYDEEIFNKITGDLDD